ncbi:MAG: hypothetical protein R2752_18540 [Vicinamibacterales bacterium]
MIGTWLVALAVAGSLGALVTGGIYALRPSDRVLAILRPLSLAGLFASIGSVGGAAGTILKGASNTATWVAASRQSLLAGCAEALLVLTATFTLLALAWLLVAIGMYRQP